MATDRATMTDRTMRTIYPIVELWAVIDCVLLWPDTHDDLEQFIADCLNRAGEASTPAPYGVPASSSASDDLCRRAYEASLTAVRASVCRAASAMDPKSPAPYSLPSAIRAIQRLSDDIQWVHDRLIAIIEEAKVRTAQGSANG